MSQVTVFWVVTPCSSFHCEVEGSMALIPHLYTVSQPIRLQLKLNCFMYGRSPM